MNRTLVVCRCCCCCCLSAVIFCFCCCFVVVFFVFFFCFFFFIARFPPPPPTNPPPCRFFASRLPALFLGGGTGRGQVSISECSLTLPNGIYFCPNKSKQTS